MRPDKVLSLLGIAAKAGSVMSGEFSTEKAIKEGKACLVVGAGESSDNPKKNFSDMCRYYQVPCVCYADKESLGHSIGKEFRASLAVTNEGLAKSVRKQLDSVATESWR